MAAVLIWVLILVVAFAAMFIRAAGAAAVAASHTKMRILLRREIVTPLLLVKEEPPGDLLAAMGKTQHLFLIAYFKQVMGMVVAGLTAAAAAAAIKGGLILAMAETVGRALALLFLPVIPVLAAGAVVVRRAILGAVKLVAMEA